MTRPTDPARFGRVAVLMGGTSSEREVSLDSGRNVLAALRARGVDAQPLDGISALREALVGARIDRVFNVLHGHRGGGEDGVVQGLLEAWRIPCTGSGVLGSALSMDKIRTKQVWLALGLPTPRYQRLARCAETAHDDSTSGAGSGLKSAVRAAAQVLGLPVILKPACEGSSVGVSRVFDANDLDAAVELAARYTATGAEMLMEQLIEGAEYTVGILDGEALPSIRIVPTGWYDYHSKYVSDETQYVCPGLEGAAEARMRALALEAFLAAGCSGWGRVDLMRDAEGRDWLLEVNTAPGMTSHSLVPKAARALGIDFETLCWRILEQTLAQGESARDEPGSTNHDSRFTNHPTPEADT